MVALGVSEGLHELHTIWHTAECFCDVERGEASAASDGKARELKQPATIGGSGILEAVELECL